MIICQFFAQGRPVPKGRPRVMKSGITYTPKETKDYEAYLASQALLSKTIPGLEEGPLLMTVRACFWIPESWPKWKKQLAIDGRLLHTARPDYDNLEKIASDALEGLVFKNDSQIVESSMSKQYVAPSRFQGLYVTIRRLDAYPSTITKKPKEL